MAANILIALGSNRRHGRYGAPSGVVAAAIDALAAAGFALRRRSRVHHTRAVGPGGRAYANAVVLATSEEGPLATLAKLQSIERQFGRRGGRRWGARVLDLDLLAHGYTRLDTRAATVPHPRLHQRRFVLDPLVEVAPDWRHPRLHATARQLRARVRRPKRAPASP